MPMRRHGLRGRACARVRRKIFPRWMRITFADLTRSFSHVLSLRRCGDADPPTYRSGSAAHPGVDAGCSRGPGVERCRSCRTVDDASGRSTKGAEGLDSRAWPVDQVRLCRGDSALHTWYAGGVRTRVRAGFTRDATAGDWPHAG